ncbi:MAG: hypothetical protein HFG41_01775 [Coprococcus sp.]|nr:hypothetical protein [Coprococcus sp.]
MQSRIVIEGNSVYEVDEVCTKKKGVKESKPSGKYEGKNEKSGCSSPSDGK